MAHPTPTKSMAQILHIRKTALEGRLSALVLALHNLASATLVDEILCTGAVVDRSDSIVVRMERDSVDTPHTLATAMSQCRIVDAGGRGRVDRRSGERARHRHGRRGAGRGGRRSSI